MTDSETPLPIAEKDVGLSVTADGLAGIARAAAEGGRAVGQADTQADRARIWQEGHVAGEIDAHAPPNKYPTPNPYGPPEAPFAPGTPMVCRCGQPFTWGEDSSCGHHVFPPGDSDE